MDLKKVISELCESGLTQRQIAAAIGVGQSTIAEVASGATKDMRYANGERLMALHRARKNRRRAHA